MIDSDYALQIANTIWFQLKSLTSPFVIMSWGISKKSATAFENMPALMLTVNGAVFKGKVIIALTPADTYKISLLNQDGSVKESTDDVYFDQLGGIIDRMVERPLGCSDEEYIKSWSDEKDTSTD